MLTTDWKEMPLGQAITLQRGFDLPHRNRHPGNVPIVSSSGISGFHDTSPVRGPGVVTGRYGTIGEVFFLEEDFWPLNTTLYIRDFKGNDPLYISYLLRTVDFHSHSGKSGVPGVNRNDLHGLDIRLPRPHEQRAIAGALSDMDALINGLDQLIAKKRDLKQAAMQQLLTGQRRLPGFSGAWETKRLGDLGIFFKGKGIKKDKAQSEGIPCIRYGEIYTRYNDYARLLSTFISSEVASQSQKIYKGDLAFAGSGETSEEIGKCVAYLGDGEAYAGGDTVILRPDSQNSMFLGFYLNTPIIATQKSRLGQGDAVVHISASHLAQIKIYLPEKPEQDAIAAVLSDMDAELSALELRRDKTRALKQGMMQELLTGRIRLV